MPDFALFALNELATPASKSPNESNSEDGLKALIFDSIYDSFKGAIAYVKIFNGKIEKGQKLYFYNSKTELEAIDIGYLRPNQVSSKILDTGYVGYVDCILNVQ